MKEWTDVHIFNHPWAVMVEAAYRKYPNPHNPNVKSLDTLERRVASGQLYSHCLFSTMWSLPDIVLRIIGYNPLMRIHEQSLCDWRTKTLTICGRNLTLAGLFIVDETLVYSVNPEDPNTTVLKQSAEVTVHGVPLLGGLLENLLISNYGPTVTKGRVGVEAVAEKIAAELVAPETDS